MQLITMHSYDFHTKLCNQRVGFLQLFEAQESVMCDVIKIRQKEGLQQKLGKETSRLI